MVAALTAIPRYLQSARDAVEESKKQNKVPYSLDEDTINDVRLSLLEKGHGRVKKLRRLLAQYDVKKYVRTISQLEFCDKMLRTCIPSLYHETFDEHENYITAYYGWETIKTVCAIQCFRRGGKSEMLALFIACILLVIPRYDVLIVTPFKDQASKSSGLLGEIGKMLREIFHVKDFTKTPEMKLKFIYEGAERSIRCESKAYGKLSTLSLSLSSP